MYSEAEALFCLIYAVLTVLNEEKSVPDELVDLSLGLTFGTGEQTNQNRHAAPFSSITNFWNRPGEVTPWQNDTGDVGHEGSRLSISPSAASVVFSVPAARLLHVAPLFCSVSLKPSMYLTAGA